MTEYTAILIPAGTEPVQYVSLPGTLAAAQAAVGGDIESVPAPRGTAAYCNADAKFQFLTPNRRATVFLADVAGHNINDLIAGDVLIVGVDGDGDTAPVPTKVRRAAERAFSDLSGI